jgi:ketopantoate reductase
VAGVGLALSLVERHPHTHYLMKRIAVMGAVGCHDGFKLARAGHNVVLIGRPRHVEVIKRQGLRLETQTFDEHIRVAAIGGDQQQARG